MKQKILLTILYFFTLAGIVLAQNRGFNYQAALRTSAGNPMTGIDLTLYFTLTEGEGGTVLYRESHQLNTGDLGIITTMIGEGTVEEGDFSNIVGVSNLGVQMEADIPGEPNIVDIGYRNVGSVPFALYGEDADADPGNEMQRISLESDSLKLSDGGGLELNSINYWEKTDSSYRLSFDDFARSRNISGIESSSEGVSIFNDLISRQMAANCKTIEVDGNVISSEGFEIDGNNAPQKNRDHIARVSSEIDLANTLVHFNNNMAYNATSWFNGDELGHVKETRNSQMDLITNSSGYAGNLQYGGQKVMNLDHLTSTGDLGINFYGQSAAARRQASAFGAGFGVFHDEDTETFSGVYSTADDSGLRTIVGGLNGSNLSVLGLFNRQGQFAAFVSSNSDEAGTTVHYGSSGNVNTQIGTFSDAANSGAVMVFHDGEENPSGYLRATASGSEIAANFVTMLASPPGRSDQVAAYAVPMGSEAAAYDRGTAQLVNGEATIICPEHFRWVANGESMTVTITPLSAESKGIAVIEKGNGGFKVKELHGGQGNYAFDYMVMCKRQGHEDFQVMREKIKPAPDKMEAALKSLPKGPLTSIQDLRKSKVEK